EGSFWRARVLNSDQFHQRRDRESAGRWRSITNRGVRDEFSRPDYRADHELRAAGSGMRFGFCAAASEKSKTGLHLDECSRPGRQRELAGGGSSERPMSSAGIPILVAVFIQLALGLVVLQANRHRKS